MSDCSADAARPNLPEPWRAARTANDFEARLMLFVASFCAHLRLWHDRTTRVVELAVRKLNTVLYTCIRFVIYGHIYCQKRAA